MVGFCAQIWGILSRERPRAVKNLAAGQVFDAIRLTPVAAAAALAALGARPPGTSSHNPPGMGPGQIFACRKSDG